jgi:tRNA nucleotidyltransferase (CCA-adding enzyme)
MHIPPYVGKVLDRLEEGGFAAYVVGGCVRDALRGCTPHDWDVASAASPAQVAELFARKTHDAGRDTSAYPAARSDLRVLETGLRHGTLTILTSEGAVEVTTFRSDGSYFDGRHPAEVHFVNSVEDDLARRDFTMNALAFSRRTGLVDPFGGQRDIEAGLIRSVGDPDTRLQEDALRIMRALRFAATLGFHIEETLARSLHANRRLLARIAPERISAELVQMLVGPQVLPVLLAYPDVLAVFLPEIAAAVGHDQKTPYHRYDVWEHTAHAVAAAQADPLTRLALLMHDLGKPASFSQDESGRGHFYGHAEKGEALARMRLKALRFDRDTQLRVAQIVRDHQKPLTPDTMLRWLNRLGEEQLRLLMAVKRGDIAAHADDIVPAALERLDACEARLDELIADRACFDLRALAVNGNDLKAIGFDEGKEIGRILTLLLDEVIEGRLENTYDELLAAAKVTRSSSGVRFDNH